MSGKACPRLLGFALGVALASQAGAQEPASGTCGPTSLTQSVSQSIVSGNSIACQDETTGFTLENHYWRAFDLPSFGINGGFDVCEVEITVEAAISLEGTQPLSVNLYSTTTGTFPAGTLTPIGSASLILPDQDQTFLTIPVTGSAPPDSALVVEMVSPDGSSDLFAFFIGSNADGQTAPSYLSAPSCGVAAPTDLADLDAPNMHIVMTVRGTEVAPPAAQPVSLTVDQPTGVATPGNGVLEIAEGVIVIVAPGWTNASASGFALTGLASNFTGPGAGGEAIYTQPDFMADYGIVTSGASANCLTATGNCYGVAIGGNRHPILPVHLDATMDEDVTPGVVPIGQPNLILKTWTLHIGESFTDVDTNIATDPFYPSIETLLHNGVTAGCGDGTTYCPLQNVLRQEMAVFLLKSFLGSGYTPPACTPPGMFTDVPCPGLYTNFIEDMKTRGITAGCGDGTTYCPDANVLRQEMAVFLLKTLLGSGYVPPACTPPGQFADTPCPGQYTDWAEDLKTRGITAGCHGGADFCPTDPVTRQEMAAFLTLTFSLVLYGP